MDKNDFLEEMSLRMEETGLPRIACQILSWLLICKPKHQSFSDLTESLQISKASVSNMSRMLIQMGVIEKVRIHGERQIHFQLKENAWIDLLEIQTQQVIGLSNISEKGVNLFKNDSETSTDRLEEMHQFYSFLSDEIPALIKKYLSKRSTL